MTASLRGPVGALLLRAGYLLAALALMAGILGMHIMTGAHSMAATHTMPAAAAAVAGQQPGAPAGDAVHSTHQTSGSGITPEASPAAQPVIGSSSSCASAGACPEMHAMDAGCVLKPGNTTLSAPSPGTAPDALPAFSHAAVTSTNYSHTPDSPSPGELSISRT